MLSAARAARVLAIALPVPALVGVLAVAAADAIARAADSEPRALARMTTLVVGAGLATLASQVTSAWCARALLRAPRFASSTLAEPATWLGVLRPLGGATLVAGAFLPALRQPLVGVAVALLDAAFVAALVLVVSPAFGGRARLVGAVAAGYAVVRVGSALAVVAAQELGRAAMLHRLLGVALAAAIAVVFERLARTLGRAEA